MPGTTRSSPRLPRRRPWRTTAAVAPRERKLVEIPPLEPDTPTPALAEVAHEAPVLTSARSPAVPDAAAGSAAGRRFTKAQIVGFALGGAALVALAGAGVFSVRALAKQDEANQQPDQCPLDCPQLRDANSAANVATVLAVGGGVLAVAGVTTYLIGRSESRSRDAGRPIAMRVVPMVAPGDWRLGLEGRF
jgi:hypothetical protein